MIETGEPNRPQICLDRSSHILHKHHQRTRSSPHASSTSLETDPSRHKRRRSVFCEVGLGGIDPLVDAKLKRDARPQQQVRFRSKVDVHEAQPLHWSETEPDYLRTIPQPPPVPAFFPTLPRMMLVACIFLLGLQTWKDFGFSKSGTSPIGAQAGPIQARPDRTVDSLPDRQEKRDSTTVCVRWSGQSAVVNGTLYYYGGRSSQSSGQTDDTWNSNFISLDLTKDWDITTPSLTSLGQSSGPPAVANGFLWNSYDSLFLYGGEFSDSPATSPVPYSTWEYQIANKKWQEHDNPANSPGTNAESGSTQRAAEGAGATIPSLGRGYYFGGHLDAYTTQGWSLSVARVYLTSLLEYTFPGYSNDAITGSSVASSSGEYRNITTGGSQASAGFPERADGVLVYVPGYGKQGIILGLAGGNNQSFTQLNTIDVYDIATSMWYKQSTSGPTPPIRVNPCAVAASAADGSSIEVYMYGGQNLIPYGSQTQYSDIWILTIPSFTWLQVDTTTQSSPPGRAGHTCNIWNAQMVVIGGYVGTQLECDSPGIYVFNLSSLSWQNSYVALDGANVLNTQSSQQNDPAALQGSYGYEVPRQVQSVIGGNAQGHATVTQPANTVAQGPLATGKPVTYTVTGSNGAVATETSSPGSGGGSSSGNGSGSGSGKGGSNTAAIAAGVLAGCLALLSVYLAFCAWIYRRQLKLYKNHVAVAQRAQLAGDSRYTGGLAALGTPIAGAAKSKSSGEVSSLRSEEMRHIRGGHGGGSGSGSGGAYTPLGSNNPYNNAASVGVVGGVGGGGRAGSGSASARSSTEDLLAGREPSYLGVLLNPRRSLRVVNRD